MELVRPGNHEGCPDAVGSPVRISACRNLRKLIPYILPTAHWLFLGFVLLFVSGGLDGLITVLLKPIFDQLAPEAGTAGAVPAKFDFLQEYLGAGAGNLRQIAFLLVGLSLLKAFLLYFAEYLMSYSGQNVVALLRDRLYGRLLHQSAAFFSDQPTGQLMSRVLNDTERVLEAASKSLTDFLRQSFSCCSSWGCSSTSTG